MSRGGPPPGGLAAFVARSGAVAPQPLGAEGNVLLRLLYGVRDYPAAADALLAAQPRFFRGVDDYVRAAELMAAGQKREKELRTFLRECGKRAFRRWLEISPAWFGLPRTVGGRPPQSFEESKGPAIGAKIEDELARFKEGMKLLRRLRAAGVLGPDERRDWMVSQGFTVDQVAAMMESRSPLVAVKRWLAGTLGLSVKTIGHYHLRYRRFRA